MVAPPSISRTLADEFFEAVREYVRLAFSRPERPLTFDRYIQLIPLRLENPKIGRVDDAEIVGDRIAEDGPVFRHLHAQEMQNGSAEVVVARVASVVGHVAMHQSP